MIGVQAIIIKLVIGDQAIIIKLVIGVLNQVNNLGHGEVNHNKMRLLQLLALGEASNLNRRLINLILGIPMGKQTLTLPKANQFGVRKLTRQ